MREQIKKTPTAVGTTGRIQQFVAGWSQQFAALVPDIDENGKSLYKYISSKPSDELEAMYGALIYAVARALSPVGVISDQDAQRAAGVVGDSRSWNIGWEQALNKLAVVEDFLDTKDEEANRNYHNVDPWAPTGGPHAKQQPKGDAAVPGTVPEGLSEEAQGFFKTNPFLLRRSRD
jgi:hypothetical protein